ncbi:aminotransferase class I/II-fold pyridoxal phosphate-dependent enzyme [Paenibacillus spiritus]|uniref:Aminotransferase n=1 Tax=Paenibacillus spiritus TaxID=2496557 RepID=A0A5J5GBB6_9BACL|nr:aminotransferase class I/II-fold pyridoxal phosphate-dependent enzyme [Paenibacillus spiritus]KAA9005405.1 aminotransferase class I/II-fold pyridoxal phosphate-dependent enzyme [Paenibacillus spiritus]
MNELRFRPRWRADKLDRLGSSIFAEVAVWRSEARRLGRDIIDLGIGSPDRGPSPEIRAALGRAVQRGDAYGYPSSQGSAAYRRSAAAWMKFRFGVTLDPDEEVLALMGSQDGLAHLALAVCNPGDIALVPDPGYPIYAGALEIAGVTPWPLPLRAGNHFLPDLAAIPAEVLEQARFILLNFPGNPVSVRADAAFFRELLELARRYGLLVVHDLAYSEMGFDGYRPMSILEVEGAADTAVEFHSFSKSFNMAGCRIGFIAGNREAVSALGELKSNIDYGVFEPIQEAAIAALEQAMGPAPGPGVGPVYERRRNVFAAALEEAGWPVPKPAATMFVWAPLPPRLPGADAGASEGASRSFARELLLATGVAVIPGSAFGREGEGYVRIALVEEEDRLLEAARRIGAFIQSR